MELRLLRYFLAVAEELHFGRAAARVHIAQPALSIQIKSLEEMLGGKLFIRNKRNVTLTEAGRIFLEEAKAVVEQVEKAQDTVKMALRGDIGRLDIGYSDNAAYSGILAGIVNSFKAEKPNIQVRLHEFSPLEQIQALSARNIHAAIMTTLSVSLPEGLQSIRLASWPLRAVVHETHHLAGMELVPLAALREEPFIIYAGGPADDGTAVARMLLGNRPNVAHRTNNAAMVVALVGTGLGVALMPSLFEGMFLPTLFKPLADADLEMDCSLVYRSAEAEPAMRVLLNCVQEYVKARDCP